MQFLLNPSSPLHEPVHAAHTQRVEMMKNLIFCTVVCIISIRPQPAAHHIWVHVLSWGISLSKTFHNIFMQCCSCASFKPLVKRVGIEAIDAASSPGSSGIRDAGRGYFVLKLSNMSTNVEPQHASLAGNELPCLTKSTFYLYIRSRMCQKAEGNIPRIGVSRAFLIHQPHCNGKSLSQKRFTWEPKSDMELDRYPIYIIISKREVRPHF